MYDAGQLEDAKAGHGAQALLHQQHSRLSDERHAAVQVGTFACAANVSTCLAGHQVCHVNHTAVFFLCVSEEYIMPSIVLAA